MKPQLFLLLAAAALIAASCGENPKQNLGQKPDAETEQMWLNRVIRYAGYVPKKANHDTRFDTVYNSFYAEQVAKHRVDLFYQDAGSGDVFLLISRIAPSLKIKRVGIGIHARVVADSLVYYEEVFRTWKMPEEDLAPKAGMLFTMMVKGKDLSPYYPQNSGKEEYIEFPDAHTRYDVEKRKWVTDLENPLEELKRGIEQE